MWPLLLDMTKEESMQNLRHLELEAYSHLVSALRAQGPLNSDKRKLLKETSTLLNISQDRHKAEIRRAASDEKLNTIAYHISGETGSLDDWIQEGRRCIPLLPRMAPQTAYSAIADEVAEMANQNNKDLPPPSATERRRQPMQPSQTLVTENSKSAAFRIPEPPKVEDTKKRKLPVTTENSTLAQHLLGPSKMSKIQQLYRQKTKAKTKEQLHLKHKQEEKHDNTPLKSMQHQLSSQKVQQLSKIIPTPQVTYGSAPPKINLLQNLHLQTSVITEEVDVQPISENISSVAPKHMEQNTMVLPVASSSPNDTQSPRTKLISANVKPTTANITFKPVQTSVPSVTPVTNSEVPKTVKMTVCPSRKTISKPIVTAGQKLIVVSNAQTIPTTSILQRTLTIPFMKNISVKNIEKFKIVTSAPAPSTSVQVSTLANSNNMNSVKHKVVTVRTTNPGMGAKKVIPLSQLQMLNSKGGIKVLPLGGKIVGKTSTSTSSPLYVVNTFSNAQTLTKSTSSLTVIPTSKTQEWPTISGCTLNVTSTSLGEITTSNTVNSETLLSNFGRENGKSSVLEDILKASGVLTAERPPSEDYYRKSGDVQLTVDKKDKADTLSSGCEGSSEGNQSIDTSLFREAIVNEDSITSENDSIETVSHDENEGKEYIESEISVNMTDNERICISSEESQDSNELAATSQACDEVNIRIDVKDNC